MRRLQGAEILLVLLVVALVGVVFRPRPEAPTVFSFQERSGGVDYRFLVRRQGRGGLRYQAFLRSGTEERQEEGPLTRQEALLLEDQVPALLRQLPPRDLISDPSQADYLFQVGPSVYRLRSSGRPAEHRLLEFLGRTRVGEVRRRLLLSPPGGGATPPARRPAAAGGGCAPRRPSEGTAGPCP